MAGKDGMRARRRRPFLEDPIVAIPVYPTTTELARRAGQVDAEQARALLFRTC